MKIPPNADDLIPMTPEAFQDPRLCKAWDDFLARYPYKKDCLEEIVSVLLASGLLFCRECKQQRWENLTPRLLKCLQCKTKRSATAGTFFDHMRSYRAWLAAIWFVERGIILSSAVFQKLLNIAYSTARLILKRVMTAMKEPMEEEQDLLQVPTAAFIELFRRRSSETGAGQAPREEAGTFVNECPPAQPLRETPVEQESLSDEQRAILDLLNEEPLSSNQIASKIGLPINQISACLSMLEMDGLCQRMPGNLFAVRVHKFRGGNREDNVVLSDAAREAVLALNQFVLKKYKGISRKDLQPYLIAHWCSQRKRKRNGRDVFDACLKLGKKTGKDLFTQSTPPMVRVYAQKRAA